MDFFKRDFLKTKLQDQEVSVARFIPWTSLVTSSIVKMMDSGAYVFSVEMHGAAYECADADDINLWHDQVSRLAHQISDTRVALHSHAVHHQVVEFPEGEFSNRFARDYNNKYRGMLADQRMYITKLYLSVIFQPQPARAARIMDWFSRQSMAALEEQQRDDIAAVEDLARTVMGGLDDFGPELLSTYVRDRITCSRTLEFYSYLLNGEWRPVAVPRAEIRDVLCHTRVFFGKGGLMPLKGATGVQYNAILGIKEYATPTFPGWLDGLLAERYPWVLSQTFTCISKHVATNMMTDQVNRMIKAGDLAQSQIEAIQDALDALTSNEISMGNHELSLRVTAPDEKTLDACITSAGTVLSGTAMKWLREDASLGSAFYASLPGNLSFRIAPAMISNTNFAGFIAPHNFPRGRLSGGQWGPAVTSYKSRAGTPIAFSWHQIDPDPSAKFDPNHKEPATALVTGPTGRGKTVLLGHLLTQSQKFGSFPEGFPGIKKLSCVVFDKDRGLAIAVCALGGKYYPIRTGVPSGIAPFQMEITPANIDHLDQLVTHLVSRADMPLTPAEQKLINEAVCGVMNHKVARECRRLSALLEFFNGNEANGLHARLARWCEGGKLGWLFDNVEDTLSIDCPVVGFDVTDFLTNPETCAPLMKHLLYRTDGLMDGRRIMVIIDEAPTLLSDPAFASYIEKALVQIRKKDGFLVLAAQFPRQFLNSPLAAALVSQPATMIFLADAKADMDDLVKGFKLSTSEVHLIRKLGKREALLRQGPTSTVIDLTMTDMQDEIAVLSGNTATSNLCARLMDEHGEDPDLWLGEFQRQRKGVTT